LNDLVRGREQRFRDGEPGELIAAAEKVPIRSDEDGIGAVEGKPGKDRPPTLREGR
jgi:hypothetical protein